RQAPAPRVHGTPGRGWIGRFGLGAVARAIGAALNTTTLRQALTLVCRNKTFIAMAARPRKGVAHARKRAEPEAAEPPPRDASNAPSSARGARQPAFGACRAGSRARQAIAPFPGSMDR